MKKIAIVVSILFLLFSCKAVLSNNSGDFIIKNNSDKVIEYVWITEEGESWPTTRSVNITKEGLFEIKGLNPGLYDIAIDFKGEYEKGRNNSKFDKAKCLTIQKGITTIWIVNEQGNIIRN